MWVPSDFVIVIFWHVWYCLLFSYFSGWIFCFYHWRWCISIFCECHLASLSSVTSTTATFLRSTSRQSVSGFFCGLHMKPRGNRLSSNQTWQLSITVIHNAFDDLIYCNYIHSGFLIAMFRITGEQILYQTGLQSLFPRHDWFWLNPVKWHRLISYCCCLYPITSPDANCILLH